MAQIRIFAKGGPFCNTNYAKYSAYMTCHTHCTACLSAILCDIWAPCVVLRECVYKIWCMLSAHMCCMSIIRSTIVQICSPDTKYVFKYALNKYINMHFMHLYHRCAVSYMHWFGRYLCFDRVLPVEICWNTVFALCIIKCWAMRTWYVVEYGPNWVKCTLSICCGVFYGAR